VGIETLAIGAALGSGVLGGMGAIKEGQAAEAAGRSKADALRATADAATVRAGQERGMAQRTAEEQDRQTARLMGKQRAIAAASGGGTGGSAAEIVAKTAGEGKFQSDLELWKGEEKGRGLEHQAEIDRLSADEAERQGKMARKTSYMTAGSRILGGLGSAYAAGGVGSRGGGGGSLRYG
jgi:hypothetical protein